MRHTISLFIGLALFWLINSGYYTGLLLFLGLLSVALVIWIAHRMDVVDHEAQPIHLKFSIFGYFIWLAKEVVLANLTVVKYIWLKPGKITPCQRTLPMSQKTDMGRVIYGNSITLTPGTLTLDIENNKITVHSLDGAALDELAEGEMDRRVTDLER